MISIFFLFIKDCFWALDRFSAFLVDSKSRLITPRGMSNEVKGRLRNGNSVLVIPYALLRCFTKEGLWLKWAFLFISPTRATNSLLSVRTTQEHLYPATCWCSSSQSGLLFTLCIRLWSFANVDKSDDRFWFVSIHPKMLLTSIRRSAATMNKDSGAFIARKLVSSTISLFVCNLWHGTILKDCKQNKKSQLSLKTDVTMYSVSTSAHTCCSKQFVLTVHLVCISYLLNINFSKAERGLHGSSCYAQLQCHT